MQTQKNTRNIPWMAWILVSFFYAYQYVLRLMPSVLMEDFFEKFPISPDAFGQFSGVYYLGYSLMHLPVGIVLDRFGPKKVLPILISCTSIGLLPILYADSFIYPILGRILIGIGSSGAILGVFKVLHLYFAPRSFSRFLSVSVNVGLLGAIYGGAPLHYAREKMGFDNVIVALLVISAALAIVTYFFTPEDKTDAKREGVLENLKNLFSNKPLIALCFISGLMVGPLEGFADVWGVQFLKLFHDLSDVVASGLPSWIFGGMFVGTPLLGFALEKTKRPFELMLACAFFMSVSFALLLNVQLSAAVLSLLFFIIGVCSGYQIITVLQVATYVAETDKAMSSVVVNMIVMSFGYLFHTMIAKGIDWLSAVEGVDGLQDANILSMSIATVPIALALSMLMLLFFRRSQRSALTAA